MPTNQSCIPNMKPTQFDLKLFVAIVGDFSFFDTRFDIMQLASTGFPFPSPFRVSSLPINWVVICIKQSCCAYSWHPYCFFVCRLITLYFYMDWDLAHVICCLWISSCHNWFTTGWFSLLNIIDCIELWELMYITKYI